TNNPTPRYMRTRSMTMSTCDWIHCLQSLMFFMADLSVLKRGLRESSTLAAKPEQPRREANDGAFAFLTVGFGLEWTSTTQNANALGVGCSMLDVFLRFGSGCA